MTIPISDAQVRKYQDLYVTEFGEEISFAQAHEELGMLVGLIAALVRHVSLKGGTSSPANNARLISETNPETAL